MAQLDPSDILRRLYGEKARDAMRTIALVHAIWGRPEVTLCPLEDGTVVWELWQEDGVTPDLYRLAHRCLYPAGDVDWIVAIYAAMVGNVYDSLVAEGLVPKGKRINICCADRAVWSGCITAQQMGVPLYTVVGADDEVGAMRQAMRTAVHPDEGAAIDRLLGGAVWQKALCDVVVGVADRQDAMDAIALAWDEQGYLMHPDTARAYSVANTYRQDAENRHVMVVVAAKHPYDAPQTVHEGVMEYAAKDSERAIETLVAETGVLPLVAPDPDEVRRALQEYIATHIGE